MITFIVPAFNEAGNIAPTIDSIQAAASQAHLDQYEIILVDDGSSDATPVEIAALSKSFSNIHAITNPKNLGLGASICAGIAATSSPAFMVVPGDNDMTVGMMVMLLSFRSEADVLLTAPLNKELRSIGRNIVSMLYQMAYMITFQTHVSYINGPGVWPTDAARKAELQSRRFSIISELNVKVMRMGCSFAEVPGYFQAGPKTRSTVTLRNLAEVLSSYVRLVADIHFRYRKKFAHQPTRRKIDFVRLMVPKP